jgi:hypothetical protein
MSGADANEALPSNLTANAVIQTLAGCSAFSYTGGYANQAPIADAQAKPTTQQTNKPIIFDGSGSSDDITPSSQLIYQWDWDNNGTYDQTGQTLAHSFSTTGVKTVRLKVTDKSTPAKFSTDTVTVTVTSGSPPPPTLKPDLTVISQSFTPTTVHKGDVVTFRATVKNIGAGTANASYTAWFRKTSGGKKLLGKVSTSLLGPGQTRIVGITFDTSGMKPGTYTIRIKADWAEVIKESKETNNVLKFTLVIKK